MRILLALGTATRAAGIALYNLETKTVVAELTWSTGQNAARALTPALDQVMRLGSVDRNSLAAVAVTNGPGSFNSVRVAVTAAKGIAWALGIPLIGIGTLEATAFAAADLSRSSGLQLIPVVDAGRGEIAGAAYIATPQGWQELAPPAIFTPESFAERYGNQQCYVCGEIPARMATLLAGRQALLANPVDRSRRAASLALLAAERLAEGHSDDPAALVPNYVQRPPINPSNPAARAGSAAQQQE